jgi:hypothetical protein
MAAADELNRLTSNIPRPPKIIRFETGITIRFESKKPFGNCWK